MLFELTSLSSGQNPRGGRRRDQYAKHIFRLAVVK
jgi:hypothetical protein